MNKLAAEGATFYGAVIGISGTGEGVAFRPDRQTPEEFAALGDTPYVCAADRVLEEHDWALHGNLQGIVAEAGGSNSHGAVVAREQNIPCVVNAAGVGEIQPGDQVFLDSDSGEIRVNGGGVGGPTGEGDPSKTFVWFNHSFMISDSGGQNHEEMVRYMQSFGLWGAMGTIGTLYDNGYAQVDQVPPGDEVAELSKLLSRASGSTPPEIGTEPPIRGQRAPSQQAQQPQAPVHAAVDVARFIWAPDHFDVRQVNPTDPNDPATTHDTMIKEYNESQGNEFAWYTHAFQNMSVAGIVYDTGLAEIYTQAGPPPGQAEMESEAQSAIPTIKEFKYMSGGLPGATLAKTAEEYKKALACPKCGSHTLRGEGLDTDNPKLHCLACLNVFSPPDLTVENTNKTVAKNAAKLEKGQRVEIVHQSLKGQRGTILEHSGKDENFDEELYNILLDNGEELEDVADSDFKKIKSASADPHFLYDDGEFEEKLAWGQSKGPEVGKRIAFLIMPDGTIHSGGEMHMYVENIDKNIPKQAIAAGAIEPTYAPPGHPVKPYKLVWGSGSYGLIPPADWAAGVGAPMVLNWAEDLGIQAEDIEVLPPGKYGGVGDIWDKYVLGLGDPIEHKCKMCQSTMVREGSTLNCPICGMKEELPHVDHSFGFGWDNASGKHGRIKPQLEDVLDGIDGGRLGGGYDGHPVMCYMCGNERTSSLGSRCGTCGYVLTIRRDGPPAKDAPAWKVSTVIDTFGVARTYAVASTIAEGVQTSHMTEVGTRETLCGEPIDTMLAPSYSNTLTNRACTHCFGNRISGMKLADDDGMDLTPGLWYTMYSESYPVPDVIQVIDIAEDQTITAHIEGDDKGVFPMAITPEERLRNKYRFERYEKSAGELPGDYSKDACPKCGSHNWETEGAGDVIGCLNCGFRANTEDFLKGAANGNPACPECGDRLEGRVGSHMECANCGWVGDTSKYAADYDIGNEGTSAMCNYCGHGGFEHKIGSTGECEFTGCDCDGFEPIPQAKTARRSFSVSEQNSLVNENVGARARNFHKVNIDGTHYDPELLNEDSKESYFTFGPDDPIGKHFLW